MAFRNSSTKNVIQDINIPTRKMRKKSNLFAHFMLDNYNKMLEK